MTSSNTTAAASPATGAPTLRVVPCSLKDAQRFVASLHRHHKDQPLPGHKLSLAVEKQTRLLDGPEWVRVGVAMIGNPSAPALQKDPLLVEIRRVCTDGTANACSMLYGAARRALRAMGYETIITYTLPEEGGASLRAAGFILDKATREDAARTGTTGGGAVPCRLATILLAANGGGLGERAASDAYALCVASAEDTRNDEMSDKIVMSDSTEAAQYRTDLKGWVSRDGFYFGDGPQGERAARYSGCTHVPCGRCGAPTPRGYTQCRDCRELTYIAKYEAMPRAAWDGKAMIYSESRDQYYCTPDDAAEDLEEDQTLADLRLVICTPNYVRQIEADYVCDELPEDGDVPDAVADAMEAFNKAVAGIVLSWSPGGTALALATPNEPTP